MGLGQDRTKSSVDGTGKGQDQERMRGFRVLGCSWPRIPGYFGHRLYCSRSLRDKLVRPCRVGVQRNPDAHVWTGHKHYVTDLVSARDAPHLNIRHPTSNTQLKYRQEDLGNIYCSRDEDQSANQTKIMDYLIINVHKTGILRESTEINGLPR